MSRTFVPFQLISGVQVVDWDDDREGINWGTYDVTCSGHPDSLRLQLEALYDRLPEESEQLKKQDAVKSAQHPKSHIKKFHVSGPLMAAERRWISVFVSY